MPMRRMKQRCSPCPAIRPAVYWAGRLAGILCAPFQQLLIGIARFMTAWHLSISHGDRSGSICGASALMIAGVQIVPLRQIVDDRGKVMHMLREDAPHFQRFGEIYFSAVHPGAVKAWHVHKKMVLNYAVPVGKIKLVLFDDRPGSSTFGRIQEMFLGPDNYNLVVIPPLVWNGFKGVGTDMALVANCASIPHDPQEIER